MHFTRSVCAATELSIWLQPKKRVIIYVKRDETNEKKVHRRLQFTV